MHPKPTTLRQLCNRLIYGLLGLMIAIVFMRSIGVQSLTGTLLGFGIGAAGIIAGGAYLLSVFQLSRRMSQSASTAWVMLALQLLPILGVPAAIALLIKANAVASKQELPEAAGSTENP